jgi:hypothetical protein
MVNARLHPADVIAHDEEDIGFALLLGLLLCAGWHASQRKCGQRHEQATRDILRHHVGSPKAPVGTLVAAHEGVLLHDCSCADDGFEFVMHRGAQISGEIGIYSCKFPSTKPTLPHTAMLISGEVSFTNAASAMQRFPAFKLKILQYAPR